MEWWLVADLAMEWRLAAAIGWARSSAYWRLAVAMEPAMAAAS
jgi:hypothetical protein